MPQCASKSSKCCYSRNHYYYLHNNNNHRHCGRQHSTMMANRNNNNHCKNGSIRLLWIQKRDMHFIPFIITMLLSLTLVVPLFSTFSSSNSMIFLQCNAFQISTSQLPSIYRTPFSSSFSSSSVYTNRIRSKDTYLQQQISSSSTTTTSTSITTDPRKVNGSSSSSSSSRTNNNNINNPSKGSTTKTTTTTKKIPFIIERIPNHPSSVLYQEIAQMCITAFFNTDNTISSKSPPPNNNNNNNNQNIPIWKEWQLAYLRTLQAGDLERRRKREPIKNRMFIARQVLPVVVTNMNRNNNNKLQQRQKRRPIVLDTSLIRNMDVLRDQYDSSETAMEQMDYMYGDIIGFVEVTQRPYGLGEEGYMVERYVLTNLSVDQKARQSGVGTTLVHLCEQTIYQEYCRDYNKKSNNNIMNNNNNSDDPTKKNLIVIPEMILEVEEDNENAIQFYRKRNYIDVCIDPTSRRYDLSGLWLQQIRCKRLVMKKDLSRNTMINGNNNNNSIVSNMENTMTMGLQALQRLRDNLFNVQ